MHIMKEYDLAVIGSGFYSLGLASAGGRSVVIDPHFLLDPDFAGTFSGFTPTPCEEYSPESETLRSIIEREGCMTGGRFNVPALESCLAEYAREIDTDVLLGAYTVKIEHHSDIHVITLHTSAGIIEIGAKTVVKRQRHLPDTVNLLVRGAPFTLDEDEVDGLSLSLSDAYSRSDRILSVRAPLPMENNALRARAIRAASRILRAKDAKIIECAPLGFYSADAPFAGGPLADFERGVLSWREMNV